MVARGTSLSRGVGPRLVAYEVCGVINTLGLPVTSQPYLAQKLTWLPKKSAQETSSRPKSGDASFKPEWQPRLHAYLGGIINGMRGVPEIVGGVEDHVHILTSLRPVHCIADVLRDLKKESSTWAKEILIADSHGRKVMQRSQ
jgi:hypothetical protein